MFFRSITPRNGSGRCAWHVTHVYKFDMTSWHRVYIPTSGRELETVLRHGGLVISVVCDLGRLEGAR